jgi:hypothetical protein
MGKMDKTTLVDNLSGKLVSFWQSEVIKLAVELGLFAFFPGHLEEIALRIKHPIPLNKLERLLRALWEVGLVRLEDTQWLLTPMGELMFPGKGCFMDAAALMWSRVHQQWRDKLSINILNEDEQFSPTFKDVCDDPEELAIYQRAIDGYANDTFPIVNAEINWAKHNKVFSMGRMSIVIVQKLLRQYKNLKAILINPDRPFYDAIFDDDVRARIQTGHIDEMAEWNFKVDAVLLPRFLHEYPDKDALVYLSAIRSILSPSGTLYIFELLLESHTPSGSLLDINMLAETGGKERNQHDWDALLLKAGFSLKQVRPILPHLALLVGKTSDQ